MGFAQSLRILGDTLMEQIGGSMGPLYGMMFRAMAREARECDQIDAVLFGRMLASAESRIRSIGQCEEGEKTLLDVLAPARSAYDASLRDGNSFADALRAMEVAAASGCEATVAMVARKGRASRLGDRSRGVPDPGSTSCCLLLTAMSRQMRLLLGGVEAFSPGGAL
jgi:dihydroxyacetone kinase-like protein